MSVQKFQVNPQIAHVFDTERFNGIYSPRVQDNVSNAIIKKTEKGRGNRIYKPK